DRRPWKIWFFDVFKHGPGAVVIHFMNVFGSELIGDDPCSLYVMIFLLDATLGMYLISKGLKLVGKLQTSRIVECQNWNLLVFGKCGVSSQVKAWLGQCTLYLIITVCEKMVIIVILLIPGLTKVSSALSWHVFCLASRVIPYIPPTHGNSTDKLLEWNALSLSLSLSLSPWRATSRLPNSGAY
uniref:STIM activating enhancer n=1 Tax=Callorhinchus milii TaxID=7868 RepID=A0A4W3IRW3_CALMI